MNWYIGSKWKMKAKGLHKQVLDIKFTKLQKPDIAADVVIVVESVDNIAKRKSEYLTSEQLGKEQRVKMGTAVTPIDFYLELLIRQMIVGERACCVINTRNGSDIVVVLQLLEVNSSKPLFQLRVQEMYELAVLYKENGVKMFKEHPLLAADYFARAAKCLISYNSFNSLTAAKDGIAGSDLQALLILIKTNLAACALTQQRYEDALYLTDYVESQQQHELSEKSIYRRAIAFFSIKEYEKAQQTIERLANYKEKKEFVKLQQRITDCSKISNDQYKSVIQKMFS